MPVNTMPKSSIFFLIAIIIAIPLMVCGCTVPTKYINIDRFNVLATDKFKTKIVRDEVFYVLEKPEYNITTSLFGYENIMILPLTIKNKTGDDILADEYSVKLTDGRDELSIKLITREELAQIQQKLNNPKGFSLTNPSLQGVATTVDSIIKMPESASMSSQFSSVIEKYFAFRPIYAKTSRTGFLAFYHNFNLEYPVLLRITINGEENKIYFTPQIVRK